MTRINMEDRRGDIVYWLSRAIKNNADRIIDIIWDERYLGKVLEDYFEGYEVYLIPKKKDKAG